MKYILDTHIFLWWLSDDKKLDSRTKTIIQNPQNIIYVSAVSLWEIEIKKSLGKLDTPNIDQDLIKECGFVELPITIAHTLKLAELSNLHNDPFDRLLVCQSFVEKANLLTKDALIKEYFS